MQINPFGFPLGNGLGTAPAAGAGQTGFAAVLGLAFGNGTGETGFAANAPLPGETFAPTIDLGAAVEPLAPAPAVPASDGFALPGLQNPTPLSQLMATAARLPAAEPLEAPALPATTGAPLLPAAPTIEAAAATGVAKAETALPEAAAPEAMANQAAAPEAVPTEAMPNDSAIVTPADVAAQPVPAQPPVAPEAAPDAAKPAAPAEATAKPVTPGKPGRAAKDAVDADTPPQPDAAAQPLQVAAAALVQQPVPQAQPQRTAPRGETAPALGAPARKGVGAAQLQQQQLPGTAAAPVAGESSFERAVAAADTTGTPSDGSPQHEGQAHELRVAAPAARHDAPAMPQPVQHGTPATTPAVAPAEPVIAARAGQLGQSLGVEVARKVEAGEETLRVRLSPEHLGKIEVTLAFDDGKLQATVRAESAHALDLLRQDAGELARTLDQAGIRTDAQSFRFEARADGGNGQAASQQQNQNRGGQQQQHARHDDLEPAPAYRSIRGDGQVDLLA